MGAVWSTLMHSLTHDAVRMLPLGALRLTVPRDTLALCYHYVSDTPLPHADCLLPRKTVRQFENDLEYLKTHFNIVSYEEVLAHREGRGKLPPRAVTITFDDGFSSQFETVRPLLLKYGVPCTFFLIADCVGNRDMADRARVALCLDAVDVVDDVDVLARVVDRVPEAPGDRHAFGAWLKGMTFKERPVLDAVCEALDIDAAHYLESAKPYMSEAQIQQLVGDGFALGAHSKTHSRLWLMDDPDGLEDEIAGSCAVVRDLTGKAQVPFAFPYMSNGIPRDRLAAIRERNPHIGLMFDTHGLRRDDPFVVQRLDGDDASGAARGRSSLALSIRRAYLAQVCHAALGRGAVR